MLWLFFFKVKSGIVALQRTNLLHIWAHDGLSQGTLIMYNWRLIPRRCSVQAFMAMKSNPNVLDSALFCFLLNQDVRSHLAQTMKLVIYLLVTVSTASSVLTLAHEMNPTPLGCSVLRWSSFLYSRKFPNSLESQSYVLNVLFCTIELLGLITILATLWFLSKKTHGKSDPYDLL